MKIAIKMHLQRTELDEKKLKHALKSSLLFKSLFSIQTNIPFQTFLEKEKVRLGQYAEYNI